MAIKLLGHTMPASMCNRALQYKFSAGEIIAQNGDLEDLRSAQGAFVVWTWAHLTLAEWEYLVETVLNGAASASSTSPANTTVWNNKNEEISFDHAVVHEPQLTAVVGTDYQQVTLLIDSLR